MKQFHVYIMASPSKTLYVGVTSDLPERMAQHRQKASGFTSKYNITRLVYFETTTNPISAIEREKQIKGWRRARKISMVEEKNPEWDDLAETWFAVDG